MTAQKPVASDPQLERELDRLLGSLRAQYEKARLNNEAEGWIKYTIQPRPSLTLRLDFELYTDQLNVNFNECCIMLEVAAHMPKLRRNPNALEEWRSYSLRRVREILTSDLKVETRWRWGRLLGGFLYRWDGNEWECCGGGGSLLLFFGNRRTSEYRSWLAREGNAL